LVSKTKLEIFRGTARKNYNGWISRNPFLSIQTTRTYFEIYSNLRGGGCNSHLLAVLPAYPLPAN